MNSNGLSGAALVKDDGSPEHKTLLEALLQIIAEFSQKEGNEEFYSQLKNKLFHGLEAENTEDEYKGLPKEMLQTSQAQDSNLGLSLHKETVREKIQGELHNGLSVKPRKESLEEIFLFLKNALAQGDLQLKEHALSEHAHSKLKRPKMLEEIRGEEMRTPNVEDELQGPLDNDHPVIDQSSVPKESAVPRKTFLSLLSEDQSKETCTSLHVPQRLPRTCLSDEKYKGESTLNLLPPKSEHPVLNLADNGKLKQKLHVTPSSSHLSFLEAVTLGKKVSSCKNSINVREEENSNGQPKSSSSVDSPIFKIDEKIFLQRMEMCKFSVVAKITLVKGDEPWIWKKLKEKLDGLWGLKSDWRLISLGKGFFHVILHSQEELNRVWSKGILNLKPGVLRLQSWNFRFDPTKQKSTSAQVWVRIYNLPWFLWEPTVLSGIARKVGTPLRFDKTTVEGSFGHFARVLVEIDLSKPIKSKVLTECNGQVFEVHIVPEHLPSFCKNCNNIGHSTNDCRFMSNNPVEVSKPAKRKMEGKEIISMVKRSDEGSKTKTNNVISSPKVNGIAESVTELNEQTSSHFKRIEEMVPDFGNQSLSVPLLQSPKEIYTSNMFSALEEDDDMEMGNENKEIQNRSIDEVKCDDKLQKVPLSKRDANQTLKGIREWAEQERRNIFHSAKASGHSGKKGVARREEESSSPKAPKRWSDILDEEEEEETHESLQSRIRALKNDLGAVLF